MSNLPYALGAMIKDLDGLYSTAYVLEPTTGRVNIKEHRNIALGHPIARHLTTEKVYAATLIWCPHVFDIEGFGDRRVKYLFYSRPIYQSPKLKMVKLLIWRRVRTDHLSNYRRREGHG